MTTSSRTGAPPEREGPPLGEGRPGTVFDDAGTISILDPTPDRKRIDRAKLDLLRVALHETLGFAKLYADVAQSLASVGDDVGTLYALGNFHAAAKLACQAGREIRDILDGGAR